MSHCSLCWKVLAVRGAPTAQGPLKSLLLSHLVLCAPSLLLQHLLQLRLLLLKLGHLLSVEVQQLAGRPQVSQPLVDGGKRGVSVFGSTNIGSERRTLLSQITDVAGNMKEQAERERKRGERV